jgi:hypothetical protein
MKEARKHYVLRALDFKRNQLSRPALPTEPNSKGNHSNLQLTQRKNIR